MLQFVGPLAKSHFTEDLDDARGGTTTSEDLAFVTGGFRSIARRSQRRSLATKRSSLAPKPHKQASRGEVGGVTHPLLHRRPSVS